MQQEAYRLTDSVAQPHWQAGFNKLKSPPRVLAGGAMRCSGTAGTLNVRPCHKGIRQQPKAHLEKKDKEGASTVLRAALEEGNQRGRSVLHQGSSLGTCADDNLVWAVRRKSGAPQEMRCIAIKVMFTLRAW